MVRNGVSVPIHWHVFVQVRPRRVVRLVLDPWWWWLFTVIAGLQCLVKSVRAFHTKIFVVPPSIFLTLLFNHATSCVGSN